MDERKNREVVIIIVSAVLILLLIYLFINPTIQNLKNYNYAIKTKGDDLKKAQENLDNLKSLESSFRSKSEEVKAVISALPNFNDSEDLIVTLENVSNKNGMRLVSVTPELVDETGEEASNAVESEAYAVQESSYEVTIKGSYPNLQTFMADLESNRRPLNVKRVTISREGGESSSSLNINLTLLAYYLK